MDNPNIEILYEDADTLVIDKPAGFLSEHAEGAPSVIDALVSHSACGFLAPITRLDREVSGVMLLAKNKKSAAFYTAEMADKTLFRKEYLAVIEGRMETPSGELRDLLFKDSGKNKSYVVKRPRRGVKEAVLSYEVLGEREVEGCALSLVRVLLHTGRTHQIRVQFSSRRHPLVGDRRYGGRVGYPMGLLSFRLSLRLSTGREAVFTLSDAKREPFSAFL